MLTVLAVDDEPPALAELAHLLNSEDLVTRVLTAADATAALRALETGDVDVAFLDIRMPGLSGLDLARILARFAHPPVVVFVTAYDEHAVEAFDVGAVDYVMKPYRPARLSAALQRAAAAHAAGGSTTPPASPAGGAAEAAETSDRTEPGSERIPVERGGVTRFLDRAEVIYAEAQGDYTRLHTERSSHLVRVPISTLEDRWAEAGFLRIHRSFLVPLPQVSELRVDGGQWTVVVAGRSLPVSRRHSREIRERLTKRGPATGGETR